MIPRWLMRLDILWHRIRRHEVAFEPRLCDPRELLDGGVAFIPVPVYVCKTCGLEWEGKYW